MAINPETGQEEQLYPSALPGANKEQMGVIRDDLFGQAVSGIQSSGVSGFSDLQFDDTSGGEWDDRPLAATPAEQEDTEWDDRPIQTVAPPTEEDPTWADYGRMLMSGGVSLGAGLGWGLEKLGPEGGMLEGTGKNLREAANNKIQEYMSGLSPQAQQAMQTEFLTRDNGELWTPNKFNRVKLQAIQSLLGTAAGMGVGALFTKGLAAAGMSKAATGAGAAATQVPTKLAGAIGYGAGEAAVAAPSAGAGAEDKIRSMSHEALMDNSMEYRALYDNADPELSEEQKQEYAKELVAKAVGGDAAAMTAFTTFIMSAPAGAYFSRLMQGKPLAEGGGYLANVARGAGTETAQEFGQSGTERLSENLAVRYAGGFGENQALMEGVLEEATGGALSGTMMGGTMSLANVSPGDTTTPPDGDEDLPFTPGLESGALPEVPGTPIRPDVAAETKSFETPEEGFSEAEKAGLEAALDDQAVPPEQGSLDLSTPAPSQEQATTQTQTLNEPAPVAPGPEPTAPADEVVTQDDLVTEPIPAGEPGAEPTTQTELEAAPVTSPMIQRKEVEAGFRELNKRTKEGLPGIRKAVRELGNAIASVFPDAKKLPSLKGTIGPKRMADYFGTLDEEIVIDETLPNLKGFLEEVLASPDAATAIQNINRLKDYIANNAPVIETNNDPFLEQANQGVAAFDAFEGNRKQKRAQQTKLAERALAVDELATTVKALTEEATKRGIEVPAEVNETVRRAKNYRESSQVAKPRTLKGGAGATVTDQKFSGKNLDDVGGKLREAASSIAKQLAAVDVDTKKVSSTKVKKPKGKAKVKKTSPATAAPVEAKTKTPGQKAREKAKAKNRQAATVTRESMGKVSKGGMSDVFKTSTEVAAEEGVASDLNSLVKQAELVEMEGGISSNYAAGQEAYVLAGMITSGQVTPTDMANLKQPQLRKIAKAVGAKSASKKTDLINNILSAADREVSRVEAEFAAMEAEKKAPKETTKPRKVANPDKVIEVDVKPLTTGKQSQKVVSELGFEEGTSLDEALEQSGISKKAAATVKAIIQRAAPEKRSALIQAIQKYNGPQDNLNLLAAVNEAIGGQVANPQMMDLLQFVERMAENKLATMSPEISASQEALAEEAAAQGVSVEDYRFMLQETGQYVEDIEPTDQPWSDEFFDMSPDEYENSKWMKQNDLPAGAEKSARDLYRSLVNAKTGLLGFLSRHTKHRGLPEPEPTNVNDLLTAIIKSLPSNNRYVPLARKLLSLGLNVQVKIYGEQLVVNGTPVLGSYYSGNEYNAAEREIKLYVGPNTDSRHIFSTALHEIVHAATIAGYESDLDFRIELDSLFDYAVANFEALNGDLSSEMMESEKYYGLSNPKEFIAEALTNPDFQNFLAGIPSSRQGRQSTVKGLMSDFINSVKKYLGYSIRNSLLEDVIILADANLQNEEQVVRAQKYLNKFLPKAQPKTDIGVTTTEARAIITEKFNSGLITEEEARRMHRRVSQINVGRNLGATTSKAQQAKLRAIAVGAVSPASPTPAFKTDKKRKKSRDEILDSQKKLKTGLRETAKDLKQRLVTATRSGNLGFMNRDVIERNYRAMFDRAAEALGVANPLTSYTKAKALASGLAKEYERKGYLMLKKLQALTNSQRSQLGIHMRDITKANIDPTAPLNDPKNAHIWTKKGKIRKAYKDIAPLARSNYLNFKESNPKAAALLGEMAALTKQIHDTKVRSALFALGESFELDSSVTTQLQKAKTEADIDAVIDPNEVEKISEQLESKDDLIGLTKEEAKALKARLSEAESRSEVAKSAKAILRESSIKGWYFPLRRYGDFVVSTDPEVTGEDRYVSFHSTQAEASRIAAALNEAAGEEGNKVSVSLKITKAASANDVTAVIGDLTSRLRDKPTRKRLKAAMAEVLASNAAYQSQLKRANVDGVAADDMARGFEEYVHVSKFTIGDLLVSHKVSKAIQQMNKIQDAPEEYGLSEDEGIAAGQVIKEIKAQNKSDNEEREMSTLQKTVGLLGFFNFLGAPSYWILNATQTYTVTLPYVISKWGVGAPAKLAAAQAQVLKAVAAALNSSDKSYEGFKAQLPPAARKVVEQLELEGIIQSTIAHEFGDMLSPTALNRMREHALGAPVAKTTNLAMQVMEKVPEAVEHYNRISTALAVYSLSDGDLTATVDAVQATQFNYDTGNRARLLKHLPKALGSGGRALVTPVMMFKSYGIGIARLLYGSMLDVAFKKGGRAEAMKLAAGLITTHTLFGGVAGGIMMAPVMAIQAAANAMFKEPDDEWDLEEALEMWGKELAGDWAGTLIRRGVPSAVGIDLSRSVNLGNLVWMGNERLDPNEISDVKQGVAELLLGPVGQYGMSAYVEGRRLLTGHNDSGLAEFAEAAIPFKIYRGVSQAVRYNLEGLTTGSDLAMLKPEEFSATIQTALGFQSVQKTSTQDTYYSDQALDMKRSARKLQLMERANAAALDNDMEKLADIFEDISSYNLSVPKAQYRISAGELARLRSRRRSAQREYDKKYRYSN